MPAITNARVQVHPSYTVPELIVNINQVSGYMEALATGNPMPRLSDGDLYVYMNAVDIRTKTASGQAAANQLPSVALNTFQISTPTYLVRVRAEYDHHDTAAAGNWNIGLPQAYRLGMRQGIFQKFRNLGLYGFNSANGEGLLNTPGATAVSLPADTFGNTTVSTYDNGQLAQFMINQVLAIKQRTYQLGMPAKITVLGPQRILGLMEYNIVQITQYQRPGAGVTSSAGVLKDVAGWSGDEITWVYDDTLIGKGAGGTDAVIINIPEIKTPTRTGINTNEFAKLTPNMDGTAFQFCDMVAPREITAPLAGGATDVLSELRMTPGWGIRPEAITIASMAY